MNTYSSRKNARFAGEREGINLPDISVIEVTHDNYGELGLTEDKVGRFIYRDAGAIRRQRQVEQTIAELDADRAFKAEVEQGPVTMPEPDPVFGVLHKSAGHARYIAHKHGWSDDQIVLKREDDPSNHPSKTSWRVFLNKKAPDLTPAPGPLAISTAPSTVANRKVLPPGSFGVKEINSKRSLVEIAEAEARRVEAEIAAEEGGQPVPSPAPAPRTVNTLEVNRAHSTIEKPVAVVHRLFREMPGATRKQVIDAAVALGVNIHTAKTQYQVASKNARGNTAAANARDAAGQ